MSNAFHYQNTFNDELAQEFRHILSLEVAELISLESQTNDPLIFQNDLIIQPNLME